MSADLRELEKEVENARDRLTTDLARLRSPSIWSELKDELKQEAVQAKDALVENVRSTARSKALEFVDDLKSKAAANPGAALLIGAGLAWRFIHRPPIATALIGAGLVNLLRTSKPDLHGDADRFGFAQERIKEQVSDLGRKAGDLASEAAQVVKERAEELATAAGEKAADLRARVPDFIGGTVPSRVTSLTSAAQESLIEADLRNSMLLGAAGVAVAAALGLAYQRRRNDLFPSDG